MNAIRLTFLCACVLASVVTGELSVCKCGNDWSDCLKKERFAEPMRMKHCAKTCLTQFNTEAAKCVVDKEAASIKNEMKQDLCIHDSMKGAIGCSNDGTVGVSYGKQLEQLFAGNQASSGESSYESDQMDDISAGDNIDEAKLNEYFTKLEKLTADFEKDFMALLAPSGLTQFGECYEKCAYDTDKVKAKEHILRVEEGTVGDSSEIMEMANEEANKCADKFKCRAAFTNLKKMDKADDKCYETPEGDDSSEAYGGSWEEEVEEALQACECAGISSKCETLLAKFKKAIDDLSESSDLSAEAAATLQKRRRRKRSVIMPRLA